MIRAFKNYFAITKKEWNGMVVLVIIILLILMFPYVAPYFHQDKMMDQKEFTQAIARLKNTRPANNGDNAADMDDDKKDEHPAMFRFNPNNLPAAQWQKLGLSPHQISGIKNYEAKGGRFYTKGDVQKMYTLTPADYTKLQPWIDLPDGEGRAKKDGIVIELNTADSARLIQLRGIGPAFAILNYRKQLGGFYNKEQLTEIYGVDSAKYNELVKQITIDPEKIEKISINKASVDDLRRFPYLSFKQMNAIVEYRKQHGNYQSVNDLQDIALLNAEILRKIAPYLAFK